MSIIDEWFASAVGTKMDPDGHYGLQCVDAVDHYAEYIFGVRWQDSVGGVPGAKSLLDVAPDEYWERIDYFHGFIPQYGDVLVFRGDIYNEWGHTAVTLSANYTRITVVQQDGFAAPVRWVDGNYYSDKPVHVYYLAYSQNGTGALAGVLRPRANKLTSTIKPQGTTTKIEEENPLANFSEEDLTKIVINAIDGYSMSVRRFDGDRNWLDTFKQLRYDNASILNAVLGIKAESFDVAALAKALAEQLPQTDVDALIEALGKKLSA